MGLVRRTLGSLGVTALLVVGVARLPDLRDEADTHVVSRTTRVEISSAARAVPLSVSMRGPVLLSVPGGATDVRVVSANGGWALPLRREPGDDDRVRTFRADDVAPGSYFVMLTKP